MTSDQLEMKWSSISNLGTTPYRSLLISPECRPKLYLAVDPKGHRHLILQVPTDLPVKCRSVEMQNLSMTWHEDSGYIIIGLHNNRFSDLFNDLAISLYNQIKDSSSPKAYTEEFINAFNRWAEFFEDASLSQLTEPFLKGLFGELTVLYWYLQNETGMSTNHIQAAWQGPYNRQQDFIFPSFNLEVKTKTSDEVSVGISSEFQLQIEPGKEVILAVVNVTPSDDGFHLQDLIYTIRNLIVAQGADPIIFMKTIARAGLNYSNVVEYNHYKWKAQNIILYNAGLNGFPKIIASQLNVAISLVKYSLNTTVIAPFIVRQIDL